MQSPIPDAAARDPAFEVVIVEAQQGLRAFARRLCGNGSDADDVVQEALVRAWRHRAGLDPDGNPHAWLRRIAFRAFCDLRRSRASDPAVESSSDASAEASPADHLPELRDEVRHRLQRLTGLERELLVGFHQHGHSLQELASAHALPLNTVKSHLHRARARLARAGRDTEAS